MPFVSNNLNGYSSYVAFQNIGNAQAFVQVLHYDLNVQAVPTAPNTCATLAADAECIAPNPFASGSKGSDVVVSTQPLNVLVAEATPFGGSAYAANATPGNNLVAPFAINDDFGFVTQLTVYNNGTSSVSNVQVQFYDKSGNLQSAATQNITTIVAHSAVTFD